MVLLAACSAETPGTAVPPTLPAGSSDVLPTSQATATVTTTVTAVPTVERTTTAAPPAATAPPIPPTDLAGEVYGFVTAVDLANSQLTLDKIDWFTGAAAQQACAEDGVTSTDNNQCTGHYYRNVNPALRVVAVSPQATISILDGSRSVPGDLAAVAGRISTTTGSTYHLMVTDGVVTDLQEMYHP